MSKKFTILVIPDDDSETSSYSFSKIFIKIAIVFSLITILSSIAIVVKTFPNISKSGLSGHKYADIALEEKSVALVPGTSFGDSAENFVRISYANSMENLEKAIYRLSTI